ncbi:hypothetical protein [Kitasatospora cineracea]|uniref:Uncharacterized protein n=1 Tax=Kitasatospora cineracea TaxID=88074 RepID=A0A3N4RHT5_9ACTN|nr:hypothetical protein [Kitasatospora cineracea]RPE27917.1 hypothetical protein EDD38_7209 [Kitasatospora cineracea]
MNTRDTPAERGPEETASTPRLHDNPPVHGQDAQAPDEGDGRHGWHNADGTPYPGDREPAGAAPPRTDGETSREAAPDGAGTDEHDPTGHGRPGAGAP